MVKFSPCFVESYSEILKMLTQNIMPHLEEMPDYQACLAGHLMIKEQREEGGLV